MGGKRDGFTEYVVARRPQLYRTAYFLCGDAHHAEDLVQGVLTKLYVAWPRVSRMKATDTYVRRMLVTANIDRSRRPWHRETPGVDGFDQAARESTWTPSTTWRRRFARWLRGSGRSSYCDICGVCRSKRPPPSSG
jgi:DNA-directed RNA polymerase specialized sigma24 family protein